MQQYPDSDHDSDSSSYTTVSSEQTPRNNRKTRRARRARQARQAPQAGKVKKVNRFDPTLESDTVTFYQCSLLFTYKEGSTNAEKRIQFEHAKLDVRLQHAELKKDLAAIAAKKKELKQRNLRTPTLDSLDLPEEAKAAQAVHEGDEFEAMMYGLGNLQVADNAFYSELRDQLENQPEEKVRVEEYDAWYPTNNQPEEAVQGEEDDDAWYPTNNQPAGAVQVDNAWYPTEEQPRHEHAQPAGAPQGWRYSDEDQTWYATDAQQEGAPQGWRYSDEDQTWYPTDAQPAGAPQGWRYSDEDQTWYATDGQPWPEDQRTVWYEEGQQEGVWPVFDNKCDNS